MPIIAGIEYERTLIVQEGDTAAAIGGKHLMAVLSTPRLIGWLEGTGHLAIADFLEEGQTTVGTLVNISHLAATPVGWEVRLRAEVLEVTGRRIRFRVDAWDKSDKVAEGEHERAIIDRAKFMERLLIKQQNTQ